MPIAQVTNHPENLPDWFTTAQTYLLAKNKDTRNPKNYRPVAFLLINIIQICNINFNKRSYSHMIKNNILREEQRGCARNSYRCKGQILINKTITEFC